MKYRPTGEYTTVDMCAGDTILWTMSSWIKQVPLPVAKHPAGPGLREDSSDDHRGKIFMDLVKIASLPDGM